MGCYERMDRCFELTLERVQILVGVSTAVFALLGLLLGVVAVVVVVELGEVAQLTGLPLVVAVACVAFISALLMPLPCVAVRLKKPSLLTAFLICVGVCIALQLSFSGALFGSNGSRDQHMAEHWRQLSARQRGAFQTAYGCCGWHSGADFPAVSLQCPNSTDAEDGMKGCEEPITGLVRSFVAIIQPLLLSVSILELIIFALWCGISRHNRRQFSANIDQHDYDYSPMDDLGDL